MVNGICFYCELIFPEILLHFYVNVIAFALNTVNFVFWNIV